jgi:hypothetical protein
MGILLSNLQNPETPTFENQEIPLCIAPVKEENNMNNPNEEPEPTPEPTYEYSIKSTSKKRFIYKKQYEEQLNYTSDHPILVRARAGNFNNDKFNFNIQLSHPRPPTSSNQNDNEQKPSFSLTSHNNRQREFIRDYRKKRAEMVKAQRENDNNNLPKLNLHGDENNNLPKLNLHGDNENYHNDDLRNMRAINKRRMQLKNDDISEQVMAMYS